MAAKARRPLERERDLRDVALYPHGLTQHEMGEGAVWRVDHGKSVHVPHRIFTGSNDVLKSRESMATRPQGWYNDPRLPRIR